MCYVLHRRSNQLLCRHSVNTNHIYIIYIIIHNKYISTLSVVFTYLQVFMLQKVSVFIFVLMYIISVSYYCKQWPGKFFLCIIHNVIDIQEI